MPQRQIQRYEQPDIEVVHHFIEIAHITEQLERDPANIDFEGRELEITQQLNDIVGLGVVATELQAARSAQQRPIEACAILNLPASASDARSVASSKNFYEPRGTFRFRKQARGIVAGIDLSNDALVIRPRILKSPLPSFLTLLWVRVVGDEGEPLVDLSFK